MYKKTKFIYAGDISLVMEFGNSISSEINSKIRNMVKNIEENPIVGLTEIIPTYRSIQIMYDPLQIEVETLIEKLKTLEASIGSSDDESFRIIEIPTFYGEDFGPDIGFVAEHNNISEEEVIKIHTGTDYLVYMLGFTPGFTFLGGMSEKIHTPRLQSPRTKIPAGSVGIAGAQTGMYPSETPGGWQLIGRTPVTLYDPEKDPPVLLNAGDYVRYVSVDKNEYNRILAEVEKDEYQVNIIISKGDDLDE